MDRLGANLIELPFLGVIIPRLWSLAHSPFVLDMREPCGRQGPDDGADIASDDKSASFACVNDNLYYLAAADGDVKTCASCARAICAVCNRNSFSGLPGVKTLDGNSWGGLTLKDIIAG